MSYIDRSLGSGETIIIRARFHWLYNFYAWSMLLLPLLVLGWLYLHAGSESMDGASPVTWGMVLALVWLIWGFVTFLKLMIRKWTTEIGVTSHRFVEKRGLLTLHTNEIALHNIEGVRVYQGVLGRILGYGTVRIEGTGVDAVTTPAIADPVGFVKAIQTARELDAHGAR